MFNENIPEMMLQMKQKIQNVKERLSTRHIEGMAAGGMIKVILNGLQEVLKVEIEEDVIGEKDKTFLEDLILSALNDAIKKSHSVMMEEIKEEFGVIIPPNIKDIIV